MKGDESRGEKEGQRKRWQPGVLLPHLQSTANCCHVVMPCLLNFQKLEIQIFQITLHAEKNRYENPEEPTGPQFVLSALCIAFSQL